MKRIKGIITVLGISTMLVACNGPEQQLEQQLVDVQDAHFRVGVLLPDVGLGDQSFNDLAVKGLVNARDDMEVLWSYREATAVNSIEEQFQSLIEENNDVIIGVGYTSQEAIEKLAKQYPAQQFLIVDTTSDVDNVDSITFKEEEGSYLAGIVAATTSKTGVLGFVGGFEDPVILNFLKGFTQGAQSVNPDINIVVKYANTYSDDKIGAALAKGLIAEQADVLYAVAGYTGVGLLQEAQRQGVYAIGVDVDQYFYAEKAVITSMTKNVDVAVYDYVKNYMEQTPTTQQKLQLGIEDNGVALAPIRIIEQASELEALLLSLIHI